MERGTGGWVTNSPELAAQLRAADDACENAVRASERLPLAEKIIAIRDARRARNRAYEMIAAGA